MNFFSTTVSQQAIELVNKVLKSTKLSAGEMADTFEKKLMEKYDFTNITTVNSGTSALHLIMKVLRIRKGDEVILPAQTFIASGLSVLYENGTPVFADIGLDGNIDVKSIEKKITNKTKAIICVDWAGYLCNYDEIRALAKKHNLTVIADAAHSFGATYKNKPSGRLANYTCFLGTTSVITDKGDVNLNNIKIGDKVLTEDNNYHEVLNVIKQPYKGNWIKVKAGQTRLVMTEEHPVKVFRNGNDEWLEANKININDFIYVATKKCMRCEKELIPFYGKMCSKCFLEVDVSNDKIQKLSNIKQKYKRKTSRLTHHNNHVLPEMNKFIKDGYRVIPLIHVIPDFLAIKDNKITAVEIESTTTIKNNKANKYEKTKDYPYDDVIWITKTKKRIAKRYKYEIINNFARIPVCSVDKGNWRSRTVTVYNLTVKENPTFFAHGILVHNCFSFQAIKHLTSVTPDTPVLIRQDNKIKLVNIGELDNKIIGQECVSFDKNGNTSFEKITDFIKHTINDEILNIKIQKGRNVKITKSHSVFTYKDGEFIKTLAEDLREGDLIASPRKLNLSCETIKQIDLLELLKDEMFMIKNDKIRLCKDSKGANAGKWINRYLNVDENFCKILGYYVAEGCISKISRNGKAGLQTVFSFHEREEFTYIKEMLEILNNIFPFTGKVYKKSGMYKERKSKGVSLFYGSTLFSKIIKAFECGDGTKNKKIPSIIWQVSDSCKLAFIEALLNGDGHRRSQDGCTLYETLGVSSEELANGLHYLLLSIGIQSSLSKYTSKKTNKNNTYSVKYSCTIINKNGQTQSKENCIPHEIIKPFRGKKSISIKNIIDNSIKCPENLLKDICLLRITKIEKIPYNDFVYDFSVSGKENFIGGYGAICLHNTGDGGAIVCRNSYAIKEIKKLRWFYIDRENSKPSILGEREYDATEIGYKYHMNDISASLGIGNLEVIDSKLERLKIIADRYFTELKNTDVKLMNYQNDRTSSYWLFPLLVEKREDFIRKLKDNDIPTSVVHLGIDKNTIFGGIKKDLINQRYWDKHQIHIPINNELTDDDVTKVIETIKSGW